MVGEDKGRKRGGTWRHGSGGQLGVTVSLKLHQAAFAFEIFVAMRLFLGSY